MDSVSISAHEVEQAAASLSRMNQQLRAHLDAVTQKMRQLSSCWDSPAGAALQERFDQLLPVFDRYEQVMEQYVACLRETARSYQDAEHILSQQASTVVSRSRPSPAFAGGGQPAAGLPSALHASSGWHGA